MPPPMATLPVVSWLLADATAPAALLNKALLVAAARGHLQVAALLLSRGADAAAQKSQALEYAVYRDHLGLAALLLSRGADAAARASRALIMCRLSQPPIGRRAAALPRRRCGRPQERGAGVCRL